MIYGDNHGQKCVEILDDMMAWCVGMRHLFDWSKKYEVGNGGAQIVIKIRKSGEGSNGINT